MTETDNTPSCSGRLRHRGQPLVLKHSKSSYNVAWFRPIMLPRANQQCQCAAPRRAVPGTRRPKPGKICTMTVQRTDEPLI